MDCAFNVLSSVYQGYLYQLKSHLTGLSGGRFDYPVKYHKWRGGVDCITSIKVGGCGPIC